MPDYYVVTKSDGTREFCTGPATAQARLEQLMRAGKKFDDLKIEMVVEKKPNARTRGSSSPKKNTKLRYK